MKQKLYSLFFVVLLISGLLTVSAAANNSVEQTTDEEGHHITIVTDGNGNQTVITDVEPGDDDITFDESELDLDEAESPEASTAPDPAEGTHGSAWLWALPLLLAVCAAAVYAFLRRGKSREG